MAGVIIDVCLAFADMQAVEASYNVHGVVEASDGLDVTTRELAIARMNWITLAAEPTRRPYSQSRPHR
jgi:hypothetical protein